jgi:hypothetical protein
MKDDPMPSISRPIRSFWCASLVAATLSACTASTYSGPVEVTRFVAEQPGPLGQGAIALAFPEEMSNERARAAFADAVGAELERLGYTVTNVAPFDAQTAAIRTSRNPLAAASSRGPVRVGVGGQTGGFGSGVGVGVGVDLGGNSSGPNALTELSVRISDAQGNALWEGRAQQATSINSPYSDVDASAATLARALFRDFPGGNGETIIIELDELQEPE